MEMVRAIDTANFFIDYFRSLEHNDLTNLKIQKLMYFSQGLHLAKTGEPLFTDDIEAWDNGPVVSEVYRDFKGYGKNTIAETMHSYDDDKFNEEEYNSLIDTVINFGQYAAWKLADISHESEGPWATAYVPGENIVIQKNKMKNYFDNKKYARISGDIFSKLPVIEGVIHENGNLVFPY
jgi:uncharacterized phage-associated protein